MNKKINIGLIGCGHLGMIHCRLLKQIESENNDLSFIGIYDISPDVRKKATDEFNIISYESYEKLLSNVDSLVIVTPTSTHYELASKAILAGINVFIEKPVTETLSEAENLIRISYDTKLKIQVGHVERFNPALIALEGTILNPKFIESHRLAQFNPRGIDVSVIQDLMIHDIDIILNLVQSRISKIDANGVSVISSNIDIANARLTFDNGCVANLTASRISLKKMRKMRLFQHNSYISIDFLNNKSELFRLVDVSDNSEAGLTFPFSEEKKLLLEQPQANADKELNPIKSELESFIDSILFDKQVKVTLEEGKKAIEVAEQIISLIKVSR